MRTRVSQNLSTIVLDELGKLSRFGAVGIGATIIHFSIIGYFRHLAPVTPFILNGAAAGTAFLFSFTFHYLWSFRSQASVISAMSRFFLVSATAFCMSNGVLAALLRWASIPNFLALVLAAATIPAVTYLLARYWAFAA